MKDSFCVFKYDTSSNVKTFRDIELRYVWWLFLLYLFCFQGKFKCWTSFSGESSPVITKMSFAEDYYCYLFYFQVIKMLVTIVLVFLLCWGPKLIFNVIKYSDQGQYHTQFHFKLQVCTFWSLYKSFEISLYEHIWLSNSIYNFWGT